MNVELGAGATTREGWRTVDLNPAFNPDYIADALTLPFADGAVDKLRAVDVLEHLSYRDTDRALGEWARVVRKGGELFVQVPDAATIMHAYVTGEKWLATNDTGPCTPLDGAEWRLLGGHADGRYADDDGWRYNAHYSLWSSDKLRLALLRAGFLVAKLQRNAHPNLLVTATRT